MTTSDQAVREEVRRKYAEAALAVGDGDDRGCCGGGGDCCGNAASFDRSFDLRPVKPGTASQRPDRPNLAFTRPSGHRARTHAEHPRNLGRSEQRVVSHRDRLSPTS